KVGDRVIDRVPAWLKNFAIENFGTSDKAVLIATILVVITASAVVVGIATVRRAAWIGVVAVAVCAVLGALAGGWGRNTETVGAVPAVAAAAVALAVLLIGRRLA
ncbi:MAG TPA: hypothetical protein PLV68_21425, partial [Ilumatobacteraceae bacterium]|nr:hypothetical protein [Ilumatobacteraceae bacterium]